MTDDLALWSDFNVAILGASAALAGLVIVAMSVNISQIVGSRTLTARLAAGIATLVLTILASGAALVPHIGGPGYGVVLLVITGAAGVFQVHATVAILTDPEPADRARFGKATLGFIPITAYLIAAVLTTVGVPGGLAAAAIGALTAIVATIVVSWVVLVEVLR